MKTTLLFLTAFTATAGIYFMYVNRFVFQYVYDDGILNANYTALGLPVSLLAIAAVFYSLYRQTVKSMNSLEVV